MINGKDLLILMSFPAMMSVGQILFREAATQQTGKTLKYLFLGLLQSPIFYIALLFYAVATLVWIWLLTRYPLSIAYPIAVTAVIFTPLIDKFIFKNQLANMYWAGLAIMFLGIFIIIRSTKN